MAMKHTKPTHTEPQPMSFNEAQTELAGLGYSLRRTGHGSELRAAPKDGTPASREERAIYTDDLADAVGTVRAEVDRYAHLQQDLPFPSQAAEKPAQAVAGHGQADTPAKAPSRSQPRQTRPGGGL